MAGTIYALLPTIARADLGVMVADPTTVGASAFTHAGHALIYLSGVCAESPVRARLCRAGEDGSVVTRYPKFHENAPYGWNIVPIGLYLEGSLRPGERLLYGSQNVRDALGEKARDGFLQQICKNACPLTAHSYWRDMVAATISRDIFVFAVKTTPEQDKAVVEWLNGQDNVDRYNGITHNCAAFASALVNTIFPHSVHRDVVNDIGIMTPKAAARSFTRWARKQPELGFYVMHFSQKPGSIPRSGVASNGTETALHVKKYLIPAAMIGDHEVAGSFLVAYWLTGRFALYKEYVRSSAPALSEKEANGKEGRESHPSSLRRVGEEAEAMPATKTGTRQEWDEYRRRFAAMWPRTVSESASWRTILKRLDRGTVSVDGNHDVWIVPQGSTRPVGISNRNLLANGSDPELALEVMAWRVNFALEAKPRMRPDLAEFREDWALFERAYARVNSSLMVAGREAGDGRTVMNDSQTESR